MEAVVKMWGNSLGIRIPGAIAKKMSLKDNSPVEINGNGNEIIIKPLRKPDLSEMLSQITAKNIHKEIETGGPVGKEVW